MPSLNGSLERGFARKLLFPGERHQKNSEFAMRPRPP